MKAKGGAKYADGGQVRPPKAKGGDIGAVLEIKPPTNPSQLPPNARWTQGRKAGGPITDSKGQVAKRRAK